MSTFLARRARASWSRCWFLAVAALAASLLTGGVLRGDDIVRVEEDWRLVVSEPDALTVSPQATNTISPLGNLGSYHAVFDVNLRNFPSYEAGGLQLQLWNGGSGVNSVRANSGVVMQTGGETVTWTNRMSFDDGDLSFAIVNGNSTTWGSFGTSSPIQVSVEDAQLTNLNAYSPTVSIDNSGVGYGANRVTSLTLEAVRHYSAAGLVAQDTTPHVVFQAP